LSDLGFARSLLGHCKYIDTRCANRVHSVHTIYNRPEERASALIASLLPTTLQFITEVFAQLGTDVGTLQSEIHDSFEVF
jgi:hypothetical protein